MSSCQIHLHDSFLFRRPLGSWADVNGALGDEETEQKIADFVFSHDELQTAIAFSSPGFFQRLSDLHAAGKLDRKDLEKLERYAKRYATRPTPFGFFSGVGVGTFREGTTWSDRDFKPKRILRLESSPAEALPARLKKNPTLWARGNQCRYLKPFATGRSFATETVRIELSNELAAALSNITEELDLENALRIFRKASKASDLKAEELVELLLSEGLLLRAERAQFTQLENPTLETVVQSLRQNSSAQALAVFDGEAELNPQPFSKMLAAVAETGLFDARQATTPLLSRVRKFIEDNSESRPYPLLALNWEKLPLIDAQTELSEGELKRERFLRRTLSELAAKNSREWRLTKSDLEALRQAATGPQDPSKLAFSCLFESIAGDKPQRDDVFVLRGFVQNSASRFVGRFGSWDDRIDTLLADIHRLEGSAQTDKLSCAVVFQPSSKAGPSVSGNRHHFEREINFSHYPSIAPAIDLNDIYLVQNHAGQIELYSKKEAKILTPYLLDTTAYANEPHLAYRIVSEIAQHYKPRLFNWPDLGPGFHFFPRVVTKNVVLQKAGWRLMPMTRPESRDELRALLEGQLPNEFFLINADLRLPLRLNRGADLDLILNELKTTGGANFEELFEDELESAFEIVTFATREIVPPATTAYDGASRRVLFEDVEKIRTWSERYLYFKVFADPQDFDEILLKTSKLLSGTNKEWFFLRYQEAQPHLRIRIPITGLNRAELIVALERKFRQLQKEYLVDRFEQASFEPETERYGGFKGLQCFAKISAHDSVATLKLLDLARENGHAKSTAWIHSFLAFKIDYWLAILVPDKNQQKILLTNFIYEKAKMQGAKIERREVDLSPLDAELREAFTSEIRASALSKFCKSHLSSFGADDFNRFVHSILHLCFNRAHFPLLATEEQLTYRLALKRLYETHGR